MPDSNIFIHFDRSNTLKIQKNDIFDNTIYLPENNSISSISFLLKESKNYCDLNWLNDFLLSDNNDIPEMDEFSSNLYKLHKYFTSSYADKMAKEIIFEQLRRISYNHLPSRFNSLFLSDIVQSNNWEKNLMTYHSDQYQKIKISILESQKLFKAFPYYLQVKNNFNISEIVEAAHLYWSGTLPEFKPDMLYEYLFIGKALVIDNMSSTLK